MYHIPQKYGTFIRAILQSLYGFYDSLNSRFASTKFAKFYKDDGYKYYFMYVWTAGSFLSTVYWFSNFDHYSGNRTLGIALYGGC